MLALASYQEALRALGALFDPSDQVRVVEHPDRALVDVGTSKEQWTYDAAQLQEILLSSHARRGQQTPAHPLSDVLRSVGGALDELRAQRICLQVDAHHLAVEFDDRDGRRRELTYAGDELLALRQAAAARRNGQPLSRVLILQERPDLADPIVELLVAEFAVQALPTLYASAVAAAAEPPDLVLVQTGVDPSAALGAVQTLRAGQRAADVPIVLLAPGDLAADDLAQLFSAGADDALPEPFQPAQLRARLRTWLLRRRARG